MSDDFVSGLHNKYRPTELRQIIGHTKAVTTLKGQIASGKFHPAVLFTGSPGTGKTTLARCFASDVLGVPASTSQNFLEMNFGDKRSIDDVREVIQVARLRPGNGESRRFILCDEAHQILSNNPAAQALLKPLEEPIRTTGFLLSSMEADKFNGSTVGKAILSRCLRFHLEPPTDADLFKYAARIVKGEGMKFLDRDLLEKVCEQSKGSFRNLANVLESLQGYYDGLKEKPEALSEDDLQAAMDASESPDEVLCVRFILSVLSGKFVASQKALIGVSDGAGFIQKLGQMSWFLLNSLIVGKHPKVWGNKHSYGLLSAFNELMTKEEVERERQVYNLGLFNSRVNSLKLQSGMFAVNELHALSSFAFNTTQEIKANQKG